MTTIKEVFGDGLAGMNIVTSKDPRAFKDFLLSLDSSGILFYCCRIYQHERETTDKFKQHSLSRPTKNCQLECGYEYFFASFFLACVAWLRSTEWAQERTGHARETR